MAIRAVSGGTGKVRHPGRITGTGSGGGGPVETEDTWDPANKGAAVTLSNGNRTAVGTSFSNFANSIRDKAQSSGKWYFEFLIGAISDINLYVGPGSDDQTGSGGLAAGACLQRANGAIGGGGAGSDGVAWTAGDVVGCALDMSGASGCTVTYYKNNVLNGSRAQSENTGRGITASFANTGSYTVTLRTTTAQCSYAPPTGYVVWGAS